jgi:biopolymer transport protein ExbB
MVFLIGSSALAWPGGVMGQSDESPGPSPQAPATADGSTGDDSTTSSDPSAAPADERVRIFDLLQKGGPLMIPIYGMSLLVFTFAIERAVGLRRSKVLPRAMIEELGRLGKAAGGFDPRKAYRICQKYPSAASTVIRSMLLKVGRPHSEVEHAVKEASDREAQRLYANVRWLTLAAAVTPLLGLLGTVWGMILAFHGTAQLLPQANKAEFLARGIYEALVTTLGGLSVAIPAAILAHFFEGRIQNLFHQIDEMLFSLLPQVERYEGRVRFGRQLGEGEGAEEMGESTSPEAAAPGQASTH